MSQVVTGVTEKLQDLLPGRVGVTWPSATVSVLAMAADAAFKQRVGQWYVSEEISLTDNTLAYDLDSKFITVKSVEFSSDGTNYNYHLKAATLEDLDKINLSWRDDRGTEPEYFFLLSCPGIARDDDYYGTGSQILIYRPLSSVTAQKIKVTGIGLGATTDDVPPEVLDQCHVNYCLSLMTAHEDLAAAADYMAEFEAGCQRAKTEYRSLYAESTVKAI